MLPEATPLAEGGEWVDGILALPPLFYTLRSETDHVGDSVRNNASRGERRPMLRTHLLWTSTSLKGALVDLFILVEGRQNRRGGRGSGAAMHPKQAQTFQA